MLIDVSLLVYGKAGPSTTEAINAAERFDTAIKSLRLLPHDLLITLFGA